jgi:N4-(beta-N-acetylglucosaminyl)-L-asparaginase
LSGRAALKSNGAMITRRQFVVRSGLALPALAVACREPRRQDVPRPSPDTLPLVVSTWPFGKAANERALEVVRAGGSGLDAVVEGIGLVESDRTNSSVGVGGLPNAAGVVQLDACIMSGPGHRAGSVAALEGIEHPIAVARRVMERTPHVMLVGDGARRFALDEGFPEVDLNTPESQAAWRQWQAKRESAPATGTSTGTRESAPATGTSTGTHDTIALLVLMPDGHLFGGCSTSGLAYKLPGRVGDSPLIGGGLYVDDDVGAAGATGIGENILRFCGSFQVVDLMRAGATPEDACAETIRRIARKDPRGAALDVHFVAMDKHGRHGAAGVGGGFEISVTRPGASQVERSLALGDVSG